MKKKKQRLPASMQELYPVLTKDDSEDVNAPTIEEEFDRVVDEMIQAGATKEEAVGFASKIYGGTPEQINESFNQPSEEPEWNPPMTTEGTEWYPPLTKRRYTRVE